MESLELRIELNELMLQELLWRALVPDGLALMPALNAALERQYEQVGTPPAGAQVTGISITTENGRTFAEITFTQPGGGA
jgi:hypothetical protein